MESRTNPVDTQKAKEIASFRSIRRPSSLARSAEYGWNFCPYQEELGCCAITPFDGFTFLGCRCLCTVLVKLLVISPTFRHVLVGPLTPPRRLVLVICSWVQRVGTTGKPQGSLRSISLHLKSPEILPGKSDSHFNLECPSPFPSPRPSSKGLNVAALFDSKPPESKSRQRNGPSQSSKNWVEENVTWP